MGRVRKECLCAARDYYCEHRQSCLGISATVTRKHHHIGAEGKWLGGKGRKIKSEAGSTHRVPHCPLDDTRIVDDFVKPSARS